VPAERFTALTRLDHNRAVGQLAEQLDARPDGIRDVTIWGNHSATQFPDVSHATADGTPVVALLAERLGSDGAAQWLDDEFVPRVAKRGAEIIEVRGSSSVASAANAAIDHVRDLVLGRPAEAGWTSAALVSRGEYGVPEGLVCSYPVRSDGSGYQVVEGLDLDGRARARIDASVAELVAERAAVQELGIL
jgi:malate dehydrogenase